ncbi:MAG: aminoglycoside phosphotransferase family protein [Acidimicrobiia bacterium]
MHEGQLAVGADLVRSLVDDQFPRFSHLPIDRVASDGTVHAIYRLGSELAVRLPLLEKFTPALRREARVLQLLASQLPLRIPELVGLGEPTSEYPAAWSVVTWETGHTLTEESDVDLVHAAERLGEFVAAMRSIEGSGEDSPNQRGLPLAEGYPSAEQSFAAIADEFDLSAMGAIWSEVHSVPPWDERSTWIHGDLLPGNLIALDEQLTAVIDFGECSVGNPTHDLIAGWWVFDGSSRHTFKEAAAAGDDVWARARGRAMAGAASALAYYRNTNPGFSDLARRTLQRVIEDT